MKLLSELVTPHGLLGLVLADPPEENDSRPVTERMRRVGTVVRVHNPLHMEGRVQFLAQGVERFHVTAWNGVKLPLTAQVDYPAPHSGDDDEVKAYCVAIINSVKELLPLNPLYGEELKLFLSQFGVAQPSPLADFAANLTSVNGDELQDILETIDLVARIEKVLLMLSKELEITRVQTEIRQRVNDRMHDQQREFFLRAQLKEIQKELGIAKDDRALEAERFTKRLEGLEPTPQARERIDDELSKLAVLEVGSPEYAVTRNYLEWMTMVPWGRFSTDNVDLVTAGKILDRDHSGLDDVKQRIIEFLAVGAYRQHVAGSILLLVGPPGVGKTSIGRSIAEVLGRQFSRFSLGGMRDEAEIKGIAEITLGPCRASLSRRSRRVGPRTRSLCSTR